MGNEARALARIEDIMEDFSEDARRRMTQYIVTKFGLPGPSAAELALEARREGDRFRQQESRAIRKSSCDGPVTSVNPQPPNTDAVGSVFPRKKESSKQPDLEKAKVMLEPRDFEFLTACPEPFRAAWLIDPEWWVSLRDGYPKIDAQQQASRYMAWEGAKRKKDHRAALRNWIAKAERWREQDEMRKAVRR